jgi:hypothetical protein
MDLALGWRAEFFSVFASLLFYDFLGKLQGESCGWREPGG